jgi:1-acyl-sn-glycerol-3-phosphate acyltransferase
MPIFRFFLRVIKLNLVILWMIILGTYAYVGQLLTKGKARRRYSSKCTLHWGRVLGWIIGLRIKLHGDPHQLEKGGLIVSNHLGYCDIVAHSSCFPVRFAPKQQIKSWPLLGMILSLNQPIWIDRHSKQGASLIVEQFRQTLEEGINLIVYPEGTSTDGHHGLLPFKSTAFQAVSGTGLPVLPIITFYENTADGNTIPWHSDQLLLPHVWQLLGYWSIKVDLHILPAIYPTPEMSRKELANITREKMQETYCRVTGFPPNAPTDKFQIPKD